MPRGEQDVSRTWKKEEKAGQEEVELAAYLPGGLHLSEAGVSTTLRC